METKAITIRLKPELKQKLEAARWDLKKSQNEIVVEALTRLLTPKK